MINGTLSLRRAVKAMTAFCLMLILLVATQPFSSFAQTTAPFLILPFNSQDIQGTVNLGSPIDSTGIKSWFDHNSPNYFQNGSITIYDGTVVNGAPADCASDGTACGYNYPAKGKYIYYDGHDGIDFRLSYKPVLAAAGGKVTRIDQDNQYFGKMVEIDHKNGYITRYGHLSEIRVELNQDNIPQGYIIGISGETGHGTGPHLHFGVYKNGTLVDPFGWNGADWLWVNGGNISSTRVQVEVDVCSVIVSCPGNPAQPSFNPTNPPKDILVQLFDVNNQLAAQKRTTVSYLPSRKVFVGMGDLGSTLSSGTYLIKVKFDNTLRKSAGIYTIVKGNTISVQKVTLIPGDTLNDNVLNILDYNRILDCYSDLSPPRSCTDPAKKTAADINYDGKVNQHDYNLWLRVLATQSGD